MCVLICHQGAKLEARCRLYTDKKRIQNQLVLPYLGGTEQESSEIYSFLILMFGSDLLLPKHEPGMRKEKNENVVLEDEDFIKCQ